MKLPFFPGCALKIAGKNFELSTMATAKELGLELIELPRWNCCGTVYSLTNDDLIHQIAPVRNFIRVQEMNENKILDDYRLVTACSMCYNTLKRVNLLVKKDAEKLKKINTAMDMEKNYLGGVRVIHYLELLKEIGFEKIVERVKKPLGSLKISPYYGCLLLRPKEVSIDNFERPTILEELLSALDVDVIENPYKMRCCGSYQTVHMKDVVARLAFDILSYAAMEGADAITVSCPLCAFNLDNRQVEVKALHHDFNEIPVFYFTQLMALAFGLDKEICGFDLNHVDPKPLLNKIYF